MKNASIKPILFLISFSILSFSCKTTVVEYVDKPVPVNNEPVRGRVVLSADSVEMGQKIIAHFVNMDPISIFSVMLNQKYITFSQIDDSTASLLVPFTYIPYDHGNFVFDCSYGKKTDTILVSSQIKYKCESVYSHAYVKWNSNEKVIPSDTRKMDCNGRIQNWTVQSIGDTIKIKRLVIWHDEGHIEENLVFLNKGNNVLPAFLYASYIKTDWPNPTTFYNVTYGCKITIDKWGENSLYSGTFTSEEFSCFFGNVN